jgi:hypothetical protein
MNFQNAKGEPIEDVIHDGVALLEEGSTYRLALQLGEAVRTGWRAWFGELELEWNPGSASFLLRTGYWVGSQSLRIQGPQGEHRLQAVEVIPRKSKLDSEAWAHLVKDLDAWMPGNTVGREGGRHGNVGGSGEENIAGVAAVLGDLVPVFISALDALMRAPCERPAEYWSEVPMHAVRQADRATLRWLVCHPDVYQSVLGHTEERRDGREVLVPKRSWRGDLDHAANRHVAWLTRQVVRKLRETAACVLKGLGHKKSLDPDLAEWCKGRAQWIEEGAEALETLLRRTPLGKLSLEGDSESAILTLVNDPTYTRVHAFARIFLSPRFQLPQDESLLAAPVRPSYELYELWTFLALRRLLEGLMPGAQWTDHDIDKLRFFDQSPNGASYTAHQSGRGTLGLYFNLPFSGYLTKRRLHEPRWSISGARRPDIVVTWQPEQGTGQWICLDAKYRTDAQAVADSFESVHIYRDALRWRGMGAHGRCAGAVLLVPSMLPETAPWFEPSFIEEHGVGVFCLTPGQPPVTALFDWMRERLGLEHA